MKIKHLYLILLLFCIQSVFAQDVTLIAKNSMWKYYQSGNTPTGDWITPGYSDTSWSSGNAILAWGVLDISPTLNPTQLRTDIRVETVYFRQSFNYTKTGDETRMVLNYVFDDGAIVYLNGTEIARINMPADTPTYSTWATGVGNESGYTLIELPASTLTALVTGTNVLAIEVHNVSNTSSDLGMDCSFTVSSIDLTSDSGYSFIVAGHAYGAHAGTNIGLHPPFLDQLHKNKDNTLAAVFLTGDIVNQSTSASWAQVANELSDLGIASYYVMGNHDNNSLGHDVFQNKHGGTYYSLTISDELYIVLNSTESDRSISATQLQFLDGVLKNAGSTAKRVFIFFHEVIWNSNEKYKLVRSNSRSRYSYMVNISNFWEKVYPMLIAYQTKDFYLFTGDVGGNPDAIGAFYDRWENVTLLSSGMGEVRDENYIKVEVLPDTVMFNLIPLKEGVVMNPIIWYNIPEKPAQIQGPATVITSESAIRYQVSPVNNATSYRWKLSDGISGSSDSSAIDLRFNSNFRTGNIMVSAIHDGFGESEPVELEILAQFTNISENKIEKGFYIHQNPHFIQIIYTSDKIENAQLKVYSLTGSLLFCNNFQLNSGKNLKQIEKNWLGKGIVLIELSVRGKQLVQKAVLY